MSNYNITVNGKTSNHSTDKKVEDLLIEHENVKDTLIKKVQKTKSIKWDGDTAGKKYLRLEDGLTRDNHVYKVSDTLIMPEQITSIYVNGSVLDMSDIAIVRVSGDGFYIRMKSGGIKDVRLVCAYTTKFYSNIFQNWIEEPGLYLGLDIKKQHDGTRYQEVSRDTVTRIDYTTEVTQLDPTLIPKAESIANLSAAPTAEDFNALLASLRDAGLMT